MGNITSTDDRQAKAHSNAIDRDIESSTMKFRKENKILLLGSGESGKSTIVKQMQIRLNGFTRDELLMYRMAVYRNLVDSAQAIILAMRKIGIDCETPANRSNCDRIIDYCITTSPTPTRKEPTSSSGPPSSASSPYASENTTPGLQMRMMMSTLLSALASLPPPSPPSAPTNGGLGTASFSLRPNAVPSHLGALPGNIGSASADEGFVFDPEIASLIHQLWQDPVIPRVMEYSHRFYLMDNTSYFLTEALRIGEPGYVPTETDVLHAHQKSTGITETRFDMGQLSMRIVDVGGQRSERKWIHCFESVTSIIFCAALSEYDQVALGERKGNHLAESLVLFESVVSSRWFLHTSIILLLTKLDVFRRKVPTVPLDRYFPDYTAGPDTDKAAKYILWRFMQANRARLSVYPHLTHLMDTTNTMFVWEAVKKTILQNAIKDSGIL